MLELKTGAFSDAAEAQTTSRARRDEMKIYFSDGETSKIFTNAFVFFGTLSPQGFVLSLEGKIFDRTATDPQLLVGQKFSETVYWQSSEETAEKMENAVREAAENDCKVALDFRVNAEEKLFIELFLQPLCDEAGDLTRIFFFAQDVTTREKQLEYHKTRGAQLLDATENADIGLWFWNLGKDNFYLTPKCEQLLEIPANGAVSFDAFLKVVYPDDRRRVEESLRDSQIAGKEFHAEYRAVYSNGDVHWLAAQGKTYLDGSGNPQNMTGVVQRITDKKIADEELAKVYERETRARSEAEEANRAKDFFLAVVSHELRSPLNTILGWTKILLTRETTEEVRRNALETVEKSARAQAKLIDDLIDSARVASGKLRLELRPLNLYEVLNTVYNSQKPLAEAKKVRLDFSCVNENIQVFGDSIRLQQVFNNLVANALKFTASGGKIEIGAATDDRQVTITIADNGQGIGAEFLPNVFQQFQQGDEKASSDRSGLGLGLSIVKILAEKHNGQIKAESAGAGCGSTFTVTLPLHGSEGNVADETTGAKQNKNKPLEGIKILIVEDDPDSREVLQLFLEQSGAQTVKSAESAFEAMNLLRASANDLPDVIVSDLAMPNEDGYSLLRRIRNLPEESGGAIPAVALSAFASQSNKEQAFAAGFQKYHTKPFEPDGIVQDILSLIKK